jgi:hypothetical protein
VSTTISCLNCYDSRTIDFEGRIDPCPACAGGTTTEALVPLTTPLVTIKISKLGHGLGDHGDQYATATAWTGSSITFTGTPRAIAADAARVRAIAEGKARIGGYNKGRNHVSSGAIAIQKHVLRALAAQS